MTHKPIDEDYPGWQPPINWKPGVCRDCGGKFETNFSKQFWCGPCRSEPIEFKVRFRPSVMTPIRPGAIRSRCQALGLTYQQLIQKMGVGTRSNVSNWNTYGRIPRDALTQYKLCRALKCTLDELQEFV